MAEKRTSRRADADGRLAARAVRECWPANAKQREELVEILMSIARDKEGARRDRLRAVNALMTAVRNNVGALRAAGDLEYAELAAEIEELKRAQSGESGEVGKAPAGDAAASGRPPKPAAGGE